MKQMMINDNIEIALRQVLRPGRYTGNEINVIKKDWQSADIRFALAFPDVYEIGMSNLGLGILYHILNKEEGVLAERVFSPWVDMEERMRELAIPLFSLESRNPIREFDVLGITYQYELQLTNLVNLLDLAEIPLQSNQRTDSDPLVIIGGPCAYNPEPIADLVDCVVIGDGEEVVLEIVTVLRKCKSESLSREDTLLELARCEGIYIPQFYTPEYDENGSFLQIRKIKSEAPDSIRARTLDQLKLENYPMKPLVPAIEVTHDRLSLEIMRGCTRGCRFCNAGMIYRPVRERSVDDLMEQVRQSLDNTGFDEISLVSLSTSDYSCLLPLMSRLKEDAIKKKVSVSFPSLRAETFTESMADFASGIRKSGLTFAPEAGTQRLRDVINKNNTEEDLLNAVSIAFKYGWQRVKLYFMIGLPTETMTDIEGIVDLIKKVVSISKKSGRKEIIVSLSPFSPKTHTPFQWDAQDSSESLAEKSKYLKNALSLPQVKVTWREPEVSLLEAVFGLGDRRLTDVILHAWKNGARFDGWTDQFRFELWQDAFQTNKIDMTSYVTSKSIDQVLPWEHLHKGITPQFLKCEHDRALSEETIGDCRIENCNGCGMDRFTSCREQKIAKPEFKSGTSVRGQFGRRSKRKADPAVIHQKFRILYAKQTPAQYTSHLDTMRIFIRAFRRAGLQLAYSQGFHAHPKLASGPPLGLGFTSQAEYLDVEMDGAGSDHFIQKLNDQLPLGMRILEVKPFIGKIKSLNSIINTAVYQISFSGNIDLFQQKIYEYLASTAHIVQRKDKEVDVRSFVKTIEIKGGFIRIVCALTPKGTVRIEEILNFLSPGNTSQFGVERKGLLIEEQGVLKTPLEVF